MTVRVIHFGWDGCYRVQVLRRAGYEVRESDSLESLRIDLQRDEHVDAIVVSEDDWHQPQDVAAVIRQHCAAPLILFRRTQNPVDMRLFDQVHSPLVPPEEWLLRTAELIAKGQALQQESVRLKGEAERAVVKYRWECGRAHSQRARSAKRKIHGSVDPG